MVVIRLRAATQRIEPTGRLPVILAERNVLGSDAGVQTSHDDPAPVPALVPGLTGSDRIERPGPLWNGPVVDLEAERNAFLGPLLARRRGDPVISDGEDVRDLGTARHLQQKGRLRGNVKPVDNGVTAPDIHRSRKQLAIQPRLDRPAARRDLLERRDRFPPSPAPGQPLLVEAAPESVEIGLIRKVDEGLRETLRRHGTQSPGELRCDRGPLRPGHPRPAGRCGHGNIQH